MSGDKLRNPKLDMAPSESLEGQVQGDDDQQNQIEFRIDDIAKKLVPGDVAAGSCGGCHGCTGCSM